MAKDQTPQSVMDERLRQTATLEHAIDEDKVGGFAAPHEELILEYYTDVRDHLTESFRSANIVAWVGFAVLIVTLFYKLVLDGLSRYGIGNIGSSTNNNSLTISQLGLLSGTLIEFISAINFWLYAGVAKQFSAFHICLERTHRYLPTYLIAKQLKETKENTLQDLVGIMAKAPRLNDRDSDKLGGRVSKRSQHRRVLKAASAPSPANLASSENIRIARA